MKQEIYSERTLTIAKAIMVCSFIVAGVWAAIDIFPATQFAAATGFAEIGFIAIFYLFFWVFIALLYSVAVAVIMPIPALLIGFFINWGYTRI
ncbi:Uncharacterised protein [Avibacterium paragallinarum]|uniref:Uncharacterized protein n=1 Tax=Avibacterium paragallinarum TaxID=728 RepID=A0A377I7W4_AVIPA|nr:hypothetical protein [Avibacterium paragallinarum]STO71394.1 Uncharacterised protein [Avibacterium paragallinarum]